MSTCRTKIAFLFAAALVTVTSAKPATIFTDQSTFVSALDPGFYLEDFSAYGTGDQGATSHNFSANGFQYSASAPSDLWIVSLISNALSTTEPGNVLSLAFTSGNVTAVGGFFYPTDIDGNLIGGGIVLALNDGTVQMLDSPDATTFTGFTTSPGVFITSLTVTPDLDQFATIDDLYVGSVAGSAAVPEPSLIGLVALSLLLMAWKTPRLRS